MLSLGIYEVMSSLLNIEPYVDSEVVAILLYTHSVQETLFRPTYSLADSIPF